jgi:zinc-binding alcohol dehydrogenase/oxidoreductase
MRAIMLRELGGPEKLVVEEVPTPEPGPDEVLVQVKAAALNRRDAYVRIGQYPGIRLPAIPGSDGSGTVAALGSGVEGVKVGQPVVIDPSLHWGPEPRYYGSGFSILGVPVNGTFAEYVVVPASNVHPKPAYLSWEEAAALPLAGVTAYRALFTRGRLRRGELVFIPGIGGGVALQALTMAVAAGARVWVSSHSEDKLHRARELGAAGGVLYTDPDWVRSLRQAVDPGFDLIVDSVGGDAFPALVTLARPGARIVVFGATAGPVNNLVMPRLFFKQLDVRGTTMGSPVDFTSMLALVTEYQIRPVIDRVMGLEDVGAAETLMEQGQLFGKVVFRIG